MTDPRAIRDAETLHTLRDVARVLVSRPGPRMIATAAAGSWALRAALGPPTPLDAIAAATAVAWWPLQEWLFHKHLLHMRPGTILGVPFDPLFARRHRAHHRAPRDVDGTLLPPPVIAAAIPAAAVAWGAVFGLRRATLTAMATYSTMALVYEWTHLLVHTSYVPESDFGREVRRNHLLHHFRSEKHWLAFTVPLVDRIMGTAPDPGSIPRSRTATDLDAV